MASASDDPTITNPSLASFVPAIRALCTLLKVSQVPGAIIGGVAASLQGRRKTWMPCFALMNALSITSWTWQSLRGLDRESLMPFLSLDVPLFFSWSIRPVELAWISRSVDYRLIPTQSTAPV